MMFIRPFLKMVYIEIKLMYQREPMGAMVAFIIPLFFFLIIMEGILPMPVCVNHLLPSIVVLAVVANAFFALPTSIATHREIKYFTQLKATPMTPLTLLSVMGIASFVMTVLGIFALITVATPNDIFITPLFARYCQLRDDDARDIDTPCSRHIPL